MRKQQKADEKEIFRLLGNQINQYKEEGKTCLAFTSHIKEQGKSYVIKQLATTLARAGKQVLVIDANLFKPTLTQGSGYLEKGGLENLLQEIETDTQEDSWQTKVEQDYVVQSGEDTLYFLPAGNEKGKGYEKVRRPEVAFKQLIEVLKPKYDHILVEMPSFEKLSYVQLLTKAMDGCLLVLKAGGLKMTEAIQVKEKMGTLGCGMLSCILNQKDKITYQMPKVKKEKRHFRKAKQAAKESTPPPAANQVTAG